jgi:PAS domain S-box-containing protein
MTTAPNVPADTNPNAARALRIIESVPTFAWSADSNGRFTYVSPNALTYLGARQEALNPLPDGNEFGWRQIVHPDDYERVAARWRHCLQTGDDYDGEQRLRRADGVYRWFRNFGRPSRDSHGCITEWYGTTIDIEEQKQAEVELRARDRELSRLVDMVPSLLWRLAPDGEPTFFNKRMVDFLGLDVADTDKPGLSRLETVIETLHSDDAALFRDTLSHCLATGESFGMRYRMRRADGVYRWMSSRAEPMRNPDRTIAQWYGLCLDIDDQIHADEALRRSERQLQQMIDTVPAVIWCTTPEGIPTYLNKRATNVTGLTPKDLMAPDGSRSLTVVHPDDRETFDQALARSFKTGRSFEGRYRQRRANGPHRWVESRAEPLRDDSGNIILWCGVTVDVHDLVTAQEALRDRDRELSQLVDMVPSLLWRLSPDGEPNYFNKRTIDFLGLDAADYDKPGMSRMAATLAAIIHPDDAAGVTAALNHCFVTGNPFSMNYRLRRADGVYRWVSGRAEPMRDENGRTIQWYGLAHDIDDQMHAEEALRERERELSLLVDMVPSHLWRVTPDGETTLVNRQMVEFLGEDWKMKWDTAIDTIVHPDDLKEVLDEFGRCLRTGDCFSMQYRLRGVDGAYRWMSGRAEPMRDENGRIVQWFGLCHDIDDQVNAEEALRRASDKLARAMQAASLAELSASIAHEVNQPLAAIVTNSEACHNWLSTEPPNLERAKITAARITRDANSAADVVSRIRALFRRVPQSRSPDDINLMIREVCRLMADEIAAKGINIETDLEQELPSVAIDRVQIQQVLVNLIRNGIEAMDAVIDGGRPLHIRTCRDGVVAIRVEVRDAGTGFKDSDRVFESFFTTKQHGMGMGLAICRSIVEAHGGRLWTANNETRGATVAFTLRWRREMRHEHAPGDRLRRR